jgi:protoporphyrin/coproporphyrin ferrochelatase
MKKKKVNLIVNFGGPRHLEEVEEFLVCLFQDQEVLRTPLPAWIHRLVFTRLAKKRARTVVHDYALIGGKSPIYEDTEEIARQVAARLGEEVYTFHRYLPRTHRPFLEKMRQLPEDAAIRVFPLFAQFSYATTGSIALWLMRHLDRKIIDRMVWTKSYPTHPEYLEAFESCIRECVGKEEKTVLLFSAHGLPQTFVEQGDVYERECQATFHHLAARFPRAASHLCYQSQFGKKEWLRPYTSDVCRTADRWKKDYVHVIIVPLSFTSDHIETLFEIEQQYLPPLIAQGFCARRCPALNRRVEWLDAIAHMVCEEGDVSTHRLIRNASRTFSAT